MKAKVRKLIDFDVSLESEIQAWANRNVNGNFSKAVRMMCVKQTESDKSKEIKSK